MGDVLIQAHTYSRKLYHFTEFLLKSVCVEQAGQRLSVQSKGSNMPLPL